MQQGAVIDNGKIIPQPIVSYIQITALFLFGFVVFGVKIGNIGASAIVTFTLSMTVIELDTPCLALGRCSLASAFGG